MRENVPVRQWQDLYRQGAFNGRDRATQCEAGWYDWFCPDDDLAGRLKKLSPVILGISNQHILDHYYVWFINSRPGDGRLFDEVKFEPLIHDCGKRYFFVRKDSPRERARWTLVTQRYGYGAPEFECGNVKDMIKYINSMGHELEQGIQPAFIAEKRAVDQYILQRQEPVTFRIYRDGEHRYSTWERDSEGRIVFHVAHSPEDAPLGFQGQDAAPVCGLFVFSRKEPGKIPNISKKKSQKKKVKER